MIGFQLTVCQQTGCYVQQPESWFDAGQIALFLILFTALSTYLRARRNQSALALLFSVRKKKTKRLFRWSESYTLC